MKQMKIAILANDTTYTYNLRGELIRQLLDRGEEILVAGRVLSFREELIRMGCRLADVDTGRHGKNPLQDLRLLKTYVALLKKEQPDVVLSFNIKPNIYGGMACRHLKIRFLPNITGLGKALEYPGMMQKLTKRLYRIGIAGAECVFFQNRENRRFFEKNRLLKPRTKTVLLPGSGVDLERFSPLPYPKGKTTHFLFVSRLLKEKGIDLYLEAARVITERYPDTVFHICGGCDDRRYQKIVSQAVSDGYVRYHGEQKSVRPFYEMAHCIVHPSYYPEGMSNVLLEAAASARPVITTERSGCAETVDDGKSGYLIPVQNQAALVDAIERFLKLGRDGQEQMGLMGRKKAEGEFDRRLVAGKYIQIITRDDGEDEEVRQFWTIKGS